MQDLFWYRAVYDVTDRMSSFDPWSETFSHWDRSTVKVQVRYIMFRVLKVTPKGAWLRDPERFDKFFCLRDARKSRAKPTKAEALESLRERTKRRLVHLDRQHRHATYALQALEKGLLAEQDTVELERNFA